MKINENNFIDELKKKNDKAIDYILDSYGWIIKTIVKKYLYNFENIKDECINDILMAVWTNIESFDDSKGDFKNWLGGVSKYKAIDCKRKYGRCLEYENIDDMEIATSNNEYEKFIENELDEDIDELLNCLKKEDRELFLKLYVEEKEINDISSEMGIKREAVYNRVSRGKKKLKKYMKFINFRGV
ncbi:sigma-70 family RNA polymerase sigma factor [Clostridium ihumii]|uniref:sigma-70 family RNA polymerase sigma factor n=1 Tax=Clostridium ihumii TaxID=1470356 RepID=UPI0005911B17|nr:sigma-70 family RNA polymerase sigma factor [Clostridium ihumii]